MDVKSLYPSVPKTEGLKACQEALDKRPNQSIPSSEVLSMIKLVLENNNFSFNGKSYLQVDGTAIGSRLGMNYASTYLGSWEQKLLEQSPFEPLVYFRYVDDVWGVWQHGEEKLKEFHTLANNIHPRIKIELRYDKDKIEFLDTITTLENGFIVTSLFEKSTDKHMYLHKTSDHPKTVKKSIPYGLGVRVKRICEKEKDYIKERMKIKQRLKKRGYKGGLVEQQLSKVDEKNREDTLKYRKKSKNKTPERVPIVLTYSRALPDVGKILKKHHHLLGRSTRLKKIFKTQPMCAYRRDTNLSDRIVHQKTAKVLKRKEVGKKENKKQIGCGRNCVTCDKIYRGQCNTKSGRIIRMNDNIHCRSHNVVYAVYCTKCKHIVYVGETDTKLKDRIQNHLSDIRTKKTKKDKPVSIHFNSKGHSIENFKFAGIEIPRKSDIEYRRTRESLFLKLCNTQQEGINVRI